MSIVTYNNRSIANISAIPGAAKSLTHIKTLTASSSATITFLNTLRYFLYSSSKLVPRMATAGTPCLAQTKALMQSSTTTHTSDAS